jgi:RNA polymerase sigma-70 factor (ECF subfamily)
VSLSVATRFHSLSVSKKMRDQFIPGDQRAPCAEESDEDLMARTREGDKQAIAILFRRYSRLVRAVGRKIIRGESEADDLLQEVFLLIYRKGELFDPSKGTTRSWIAQIAYHRAIDRRRQLTARHFYTEVDLNGDALDNFDMQRKAACYAESLEGTFGKVGLRDMFGSLSENQRETLKLYFFDGYTFDEIAAKTGQSVGNVRNHYYRGLDRLRKRMFAGK